MRVPALLLFFLFIWPQSSIAEPVLAIDRQQVNIREDATTQSRRVGVLYRGDQVTELRRHAGWIQIRLTDGRIGWVHSALVQPRLIVEGEGVRVRSAPSTREDAVTMVFRGQELGVVEKRGDWLSVTVSDGRSGWIHKRFTRPKTDEDIRAVMPAKRDLSEDLEGRREAPADDIAGRPEEAPPGEAVEIESQYGVDEVPFALRRNPYAEGLQQEASGDYAAALAQFEEVLVEEPDNVNALFHAAQSQTHLGELVAAAELLYRAIELTGGRKDLYLTLSEVYRRKGIPDSAAKYESMFTGQQVTSAQSEDEATRTELERAGGAAEQAAAERPVAAAPAAEQGGDDDGDPSPTSQMEEADEPESVEPETGAGRLHLFALGSGALALILVAAIWIGVRMGRGGSAGSGGKKEREGSSKFSKVIQEESQAAGHGRATSEEEEELDRQIDDKWRELRQSSELFAPAQEGTGGEEGQLNRMLDHVEALREALDMQDERAVIYADVVRLQNMKIEAMNEEIRLLRKARKS